MDGSHEIFKYDETALLRPAYLANAFTIICSLEKLSIGPRKKDGMSLTVMTAVSTPLSHQLLC